ncbi:ABC transporter ATP-binding protein [Aureimonas populi]|uniref:ABC transporter ATP-binding protein n=1 Tax=Aureimonas populi TaxID=1701758 RepID=A0ABW5CSJ5_9HYPH|nr:ABC transporter ATP-binding protein [Aureimonas populi]
MISPAKPSPALLEVENLRLSVPTDEGRTQILKGVDLTLRQGEVLGVAGESGCGKSTLIKTILGIAPRKARVDAGSVRLAGKDLLEAPRGSALRRTFGFIPQDPWLAMNPVFRVGTQMMEILRWNGLPGEEPRPIRRSERARYREHLVSLLRAVRLPDPEGALERYPHQFSGGQRQRILIASALASRPRALLADEPTTALDVTTQLEILKLLQELVAAHDMTMLFVTHDFGVISQLCDRVAVMYAGRVVETGRTRQIIDAPSDPYTAGLIAAHPDRGGFSFVESGKGGRT